MEKKHGDRLTGNDFRLRGRIQGQIEKALDKIGASFSVSESHLSESIYFSIDSNEDGAESFEIRVANHDDRNGSDASMVYWVDGDFAPSKIAKLVKEIAIKKGAFLRKPEKEIRFRAIPVLEFFELRDSGKTEPVAGYLASCARVIETGEYICWE